MSEVKVRFHLHVHAHCPWWEDPSPHSAFESEADLLRAIEALQRDERVVALWWEVEMTERFPPLRRGADWGEVE